jgi:chromosome segregation ATPase
MCLFPVLTLCLQAQYEALKNTLKNVEQEPAQTKTSLAETKRMFKNAREDGKRTKMTRSRDGRRL